MTDTITCHHQNRTSMTKVVMTAWKENMQKVSLTKLQVMLLGLSLKESKENVDHLLNGEEVAIDVVALEQAQRFSAEAQRIGVQCRASVTTNPRVAQGSIRLKSS
ncbi:MAG: hypothetical protein WA958_13190 [Tunicatimonas sp.]